jgi:Casein kinase II regulatory subunit
LAGQVPFYNEALSMILDGDYGFKIHALQDADMQEDEYRRQPPDIQIVENSAEMLYGLIHQRWIISRAGLQAMVSPSYHDQQSNPLVFRPTSTNMHPLDIVPVSFVIQLPSYPWEDQIVQPLIPSNYSVHHA